MSLSTSFVMVVVKYRKYKQAATILDNFFSNLGLTQDHSITT